MIIRVAIMQNRMDVKYSDTMSWGGFSWGYLYNVVVNPPVDYPRVPPRTVLRTADDGLGNNMDVTSSSLNLMLKRQKFTLSIICGSMRVCLPLRGR
jgi:hypothetical protein